jgi:hypothetical protein
MNRIRTIACGLTAALALTAASTACASLVTGSLSFTGTGFGAGAPVDPIVGSVSFSFDNSATFFGAADGSVQNGVPVSVSVTALNLPGNWTPVLTFIQSGMVGGMPVSDLMSIGHVLNGTGTVAGTDDWRIAFNTISATPGFREFTYTVAGRPELFQSFVGQVSQVPEPATLALGAVGLAAVLARYRRRPGRPSPRWVRAAA